MPEPTTGTIIGGAKVAVDIYKFAKELGWIDLLRTFWQKRKRVLVLGSTGTGKSELIQWPKKILPDLLLHTDRTAFATKATLKTAEGTLWRWSIRRDSVVISRGA